MLKSKSCRLFERVKNSLGKRPQLIKNTDYHPLEQLAVKASVL